MDPDYVPNGEFTDMGESDGNADLYFFSADGVLILKKQDLFGITLKNNMMDVLLTMST